MSETIEGRGNEILKWNAVYASKGLKINLEKANVIFSRSMTKEGFYKSNLIHVGSAAWE